MELVLSDLSEINSVATQFLNSIGNRKVFAFDGEMGVGKTTFISNVLSQMGIKDLEGSPTYSIVNAYESPTYGKIFHFDVYRLKNEMEAYDSGLDEIIDSGAFCFIEWPEKIETLLPEDTLWVYIRKLEDDSRTITFNT